MQTANRCEAECWMKQINDRNYIKYKIETTQSITLYLVMADAPSALACQSATAATSRSTGSI